MSLPVVTPNLDHLTAWLGPLLARCGDRRTAHTLTGIVGGILGSGRLVCGRIAAVSPSARRSGPCRTPGPPLRARWTHPAQRAGLDHPARRPAGGGLVRLQAADDRWLILDGSDLRNPHAQQRDALQPVLPLGGRGTVSGDPTLTLLGLGGDGRRGILDHRRYSRNADDFVSQPSLVRQLITQAGASLWDWTQPGTRIMDRSFDDQAIGATGWRQGWQLVWRVTHRERKVRRAPGTLE
jgi:hypothetical protein